MHQQKMEKNALLSDLESPPNEVIDNIVIFDDESTFQTNDDQPTL